MIIKKLKFVYLHYHLQWSSDLVLQNKNGSYRILGWHLEICEEGSDPLHPINGLPEFKKRKCSTTFINKNK